MKRVVVVGLGLIGGSIARALQRHLAKPEIVGIDQRSVIDTALCRQLLTRAVDVTSMSASASEVVDADLIVLAMPVGVIEGSVTNWLRSGIPVTDCGSTKQTIAAAALKSPHCGWFVPGHPMAGRERGGLAGADADLFRGRRWIVCPELAKNEAIYAARWLVDALGAIWTEMTPAEHDAAVALSSHVPQILASWLVSASSEHTWMAAGPAFSDMTRIAGGAESIWKDIFATNAIAVADLLREASRELSAIAEELGSQQPKLERVTRLLAAARTLPKTALE